MRAPIDVDGPRPAVSWVSSLPASWTSAHERLVLYALACDAFDNVSTPGSDNLTQWTGMARSKVWQVLRSLLSDAAQRPSLIERVDDHGRPAQAPSGRKPSRYRLRTELDPSDRGGRLTVQTGETVGQSVVEVNRPDGVDGSEAQPSWQPSWQPSTPGETLPSLPSVITSSSEPHVGAGDDDRELKHPDPDRVRELARAAREQLRPTRSRS